MIHRFCAIAKIIRRRRRPTTRYAPAAPLSLQCEAQPALTQSHPLIIRRRCSLPPLQGPSSVLA